MNTIIIPGYGDVKGYIRFATTLMPGWRRLKPTIHVFGWSGDAKTYDAKWDAFDNKLNQVGEVAVIGISAGASVALRALSQYPDKVKKVITICGPVDIKKMNQDTLHDKYPILERSLEYADTSNELADRVMTMRPIHDEVVDIEAMVLNGAHDFQLGSKGHALSITKAVFAQSKAIADWVQS